MRPAKRSGRPSPLYVNCSGTRCPASRRSASRHSTSRKSRSRLKWWCVSPEERNTGHGHRTSAGVSKAEARVSATLPGPELPPFWARRIDGDILEHEFTEGGKELGVLSCNKTDRVFGARGLNGGGKDAALEAWLRGEVVKN